MNSFRNETAFTNDFGKEEALKCAKAFFKRKNHESKRLVIFGAGEGNRTLVASLGSWKLNRRKPLIYQYFLYASFSSDIQFDIQSLLLIFSLADSIESSVVSV